MSQRGSFWLILPAGTKIVARGGWDAPSFRLPQTAAAFVNRTWEDSFLIRHLSYEDGTQANTGLTHNYVMRPPENFAQGTTEKEAWANFRRP